MNISPHHVDSIESDKIYVTKNRYILKSYMEKDIADVGIAPSVYIYDLVNKMKSNSRLPLAKIQESIQKAAEIFLYDEVNGLTINEYIKLVHQSTGLPVSIIDSSTKNIYESLKNIEEIIQEMLPSGMIISSKKKLTEGVSIPARRGNILSIIAAGNGPGLHALWPQAIALGYKVIVKPSNIEPFTAQRLVSSLHRAGLKHYIALCCTDHRGVGTLIDSTDLSIVYGDANTVKKYSNNPKVLVQGPGYSKVIVSSDSNNESAIALAAKSIVSLGGAACVSASSIFVEGDSRLFAEKLNDYIKSNISINDLPKVSLKKLGFFKEALNSYRSDGNFKFNYKEFDGAYILYPYIDFSVQDNKDLRQRELLFPCVSVLPFEQQNLYDLLKGSLSVTLYSKNIKMINEVLSCPDIGNIYVGDIPTTWMSNNLPHDGYISEFLIKGRSVRFSDDWIMKNSEEILAL